MFRECWKLHEGCHGRASERLQTEAKNNRDLIQRLVIADRLEKHRGCVNSICWNDSGTKLLSGSDDQHLIITDPFSQKTIKKLKTQHRSNIFSAKFLPHWNDVKIVSCSGDGVIYYTDVSRCHDVDISVGVGVSLVHTSFNCHHGTTYELETVTDEPYSFLSAGEDGTVRWFDLRLKNTCNKVNCQEDVLIQTRRAVTSLTIDPMRSYNLAIGCSDSTVRIFDRRMLSTYSTGGASNTSGRSITGIVSSFCPPSCEGQARRVTSLKYSKTGQEILASYSCDNLYLYNVREENESKELSIASARDDSSSDERPPIKRLRLRGDWSDTGPSSRPRHDTSTAGSILSRFSDLLTRWFEESTTDQQSEGQGQGRSDELQGQTSSSQNQGHLPTSGTNMTSGENVSSGSSLGERQSLAEKHRDLKRARETAKATDQPNSESSQSGATTSAVVEDGNQHLEADNRLEAMDIDTGQLEDQDTTPKENAVPMLADEPQRSLNDLDPSAHPPRGAHPVVPMVSRGIQTHPDDLESEPPELDICVRIRRTQEHVLESHVEVNRSFDVNPLFTLHYCSQGTSASTISVGVSPSEEVEPLPPMQTEYQGSLAEENDTDETLTGADTQQSETVEVKQCDNDDIVHGNKSPTADISEANSDMIDTDHTQLPAIEKNPDPPISENRQSTVGKADTCNEVITDSEFDLYDCRKPNQYSEATMASGSTTENPENRCSEDTTASGSTVENPENRCSEATTTSGSNVENRFIEVTTTSGSNVENTASYSKATAASGNPANPNPASQYSEATTASGSTVDNPANPNPASQYSEATTASGSTVDNPDQCANKNPGQMQDAAEAYADHLFDSSDEETEDEETLEEARRARVRASLKTKFKNIINRQKEEKEKEDTAMKSINQRQIKMTFKGHRNSRTMIKEASFWGDQYVMSGSDCGHVFIWDKITGEVVQVLEADRHVVNCVQPHPFDPILATSGIDYDIKIWSPIGNSSQFDRSKVDDLVRINNVMLQETRDTITVPASFMLRMLASLNHIRSVRQGTEGNDNTEPGTDQG